MRGIGIGLGVLASLGGIGRIAVAHPGHGNVPADSPLHYVVEPTHGWWIVVALACGLSCAAYLLRRRLTQATARRTGRPDSNRPAVDE